MFLIPLRRWDIFVFNSPSWVLELLKNDFEMIPPRYVFYYLLNKELPHLTPLIKARCFSGFIYNTDIQNKSIFNTATLWVALTSDVQYRVRGKEGEGTNRNSCRSLPGGVLMVNPPCPLTWLWENEWLPGRLHRRQVSKQLRYFFSALSLAAPPS